MGAINLCRGHCPRLCRFLPRTDPQGPQTSWQGQGNTGYQVSQSLVQQRAKSELPWRWRAVRHSMSQCQALPWDVAHGRATGSAPRASAAMPRPPTPGCSASAVTGILSLRRGGQQPTTARCCRDRPTTARCPCGRALVTWGIFPWCLFRRLCCCRSFQAPAMWLGPAVLTERGGIPGSHAGRQRNPACGLPLPARVRK